MMIPTIKVKRPDGKGYHLVNAPTDAPTEQPAENEAPAQEPAPKKRAARSKKEA